MMDIASYWYAHQSDYFQAVYYGGDDTSGSVSLLQHNGWFGVQSEHPAYSSFAKLIDRPGNILDLGCGNGILLKMLMENAQQPLIPFGVDFLSRSIIEARTLILPTFASNFVVANIADSDFFHQMFSYILLCPAYLHPDSVVAFLSRCLDHLITDGGRLILYEYSDVSVLCNHSSVAMRDGRQLHGVKASDSVTNLLWFQK